MKAKKKVSVITPFFQRTRGLLEKAVRSALGQRGEFDLKIVIVDDGSPISAMDELGSLLSQHPQTFDVRRQKNAGCYPASNTALDCVSEDTDIVAFLDSDDEWSEGHLRRAVWAIEQGYDFYFSDFYQLNQQVSAFERGRRIRLEDHKRIHPAEPIHEFAGSMFDQIIKGNILGTSTIVYDYRKFKDLRYLTDFNHTGAEYILWLNMARRSKRIAFSSQPECRYGGGVNIYSESAWGSNKYLSVRYDEIRYRKHILDHFSLTDDQESRLRLKNAESRQNFAKGFWHNVLHRQPGVGALLLRQLKADPQTIPHLLAEPPRIVLGKLRPSPS
jgi:succinoglycan biosynthesis protein ExoW